MYYKVLAPHPALRPYIGCYWILKTEAAYQAKEELIIPDGYAEIILNMGQAYTWQSAAGPACANIRNTHITGQRSVSVYVKLPACLYQVGIKLKPLALSPWLNLPSVQLTNQLVHTGDLSDQSFAILAEKLYVASSETAHKQLLDQFFLKKLPTHTVADPVAQGAVARIVAQKGMLRMDELKNTLGIDYSTLERKFKSAVGLTPKEFARVIRFKNVYKAFRSYHSSDKAFFLDWGYYDQSHFLKDFKFFMGNTPGVYQAGMSGFSDTILKMGLMQRQS